MKKHLYIYLIRLLVVIMLWNNVHIFSQGQGNSTSSTNNNPIAPNNVKEMKKHFTIFNSITPLNRLNPSVKTSYDSECFYIHSNGIPEHNMMVGITNWQQQIPLPQDYTGENAWAIPIAPKLATSPMSTKDYFFRGAIAVAINGVPIFNALNNRGEDAYLIGELDEWGGHAGRADDYHYHMAPLHLLDSIDGPIAYALDGFPIYGKYETTGREHLPLDENHGHFADGSYHYHATTTYPYFIGKLVGQVTLENGNAKDSPITPQARATPVRPPTTPLRGAKITNFQKAGENNYILTYTIDNANVSYQVNYQWDPTQKTYTFQYLTGDQITKTEEYNAKSSNQKLPKPKKDKPKK